VTSPVVFIRGMNENTTPEHISEFFKDEKLEKIDLIKNSNGKFMGRAFIEFPTVEDAKKAFKKNHKLLHGSIISLEMSNEQDRRSILSQMK
jgi:RNA recognition motif-containing protein